MVFIGEKEQAANEFFAQPNASIDKWLNKRGLDADFLLFKAAEHGNINVMAELVSKHGANINASVHTQDINYDEYYTATPVFAAVHGSSIAALEWLLKRNANPNEKCFIGGCLLTPLFSAAENGNVRLAKLLLDAGAEVNQSKSTNGNTPLYIAVQNHHPAMVSLLLQFDADPNKFLQPRTMQTTSPLERAVGSGDPKIVAQMIHAGSEITIYAIVILSKVQETKVSIDQFRRSISDQEIDEIKDLLAGKSHLKDNSKYEKAKRAEKSGKYRQALELLRSLHEECACTQTRFDIDRVIEAIYGVRGSDSTISIWDQVPLMSQTEPTHYQDYAWAQLGRKIYRHGGFDKAEVIVQREELWELDIDTRIWRKCETTGKSPGPRSGHTMFAWENHLYVWGGRVSSNMGPSSDAKLYRLAVREGEPLTWEIVKSTMKPVGREDHAGCVYKGKYYITGGRIAGSSYPTNETWVLNLSTFKWKPMKDGPIDRVCHGMWAANDKLFVLGGRRFHRDPTMHPYNAAYSIEHFVSFDIRSNEWFDEPILGDRPYDTSEFTVLPLFNNNIDDDPSSVIIWGGYGQVDFKNGPNVNNVNEMKALYGEEYHDFTFQYRKRLLRFYPDTYVWRHLRSTTTQLPKAQSFAAEIKCSNGSLELLIGGGYGFTGESMHEDTVIDGINKFQFASPKPNNKVFHVVTGDSGKSYALLDNINGRSWAWDFCTSAGEKSPQQYFLDISPCSPNLHNAIDFTHEDFSEPPCDSVHPNDKALLGVRVELCQLVGRSDLNGKIGRCGLWQPKSERYQIFIPNYEDGGPCALSVKPANLRIAPKLGIENSGIQVFMAKNESRPKKFPDVIFSLNFFYDPQSVKQSIVDQIMEPCASSDRDGIGHFLKDTYYGPLSRKAQVVTRALSMKESETTIGVVLCPDLSKVKSSHQAQMKRFLDIYSEFVTEMREKDIPRVKAFEKRLAKISDADVKAKCSQWLKVEAAVDGILPSVSRVLLVNPNVDLQSLNNNVLCPAFGWKSFHSSGYFRQCSMDFIPKNGTSRSSRSKDDHKHAIQVASNECWIGPKKSMTIDTMHLPFYIGASVAEDRDITLGQLFTCDDLHDDTLYLQWVHDVGDWWSHSIRVSRYDESEDVEIPDDTTIAYLVKGSGGALPEDVGGIRHYMQNLVQLRGQVPVDTQNHEGVKSQLNPGSEQWWQLFNKGYRSGANRIKFLSNPLKFDIALARNDMETELRRPKPKSRHGGTGRSRFDTKTGLSFDMHTRATISVPEKATDVCAYCGITVALNKCKACYTVSYCSPEHNKLNWPNHKADCKRLQKQRKNN